MVRVEAGQVLATRGVKCGGVAVPFGSYTVSTVYKTLLDRACLSIMVQFFWNTFGLCGRFPGVMTSSQSRRWSPGVWLDQPKDDGMHGDFGVLAHKCAFPADCKLSD